MRVLGIDPGDRYCGVAYWVNGKLRWTNTISPDELHALLTTVNASVFVCEEFRLYPWMASRQGFSEMKTAEVIGVIKLITKQRNKRLVMQPAATKKVAAGHMRSRGVALTGKTQHAKDAEYHGWYWLWQNERKRVVSLIKEKGKG